MKIQGWFYPLRSGSFSAEIQQKRKTLLREKTNCETIPAEFLSNFSGKGTTPQRVKPTSLFHSFSKIKFQKKNQEGKKYFSQNENPRLVLPSEEWFLFC